MMSEMVKWLNADLEIHPVLVSGIAQFQLVHIHPFLDGNGRTSRLLSTLCLYKVGYDFKWCMGNRRTLENLNHQGDELPGIYSSRIVLGIFPFGTSLFSASIS